MSYRELTHLALSYVGFVTIVLLVLWLWIAVMWAQGWKDYVRRKREQWTNKKHERSTKKH